MSKQQNNTNAPDSLEQLYLRRKARYRSPDEVKQQMLNSLNTQQQSSVPWWRINFHQYAKVSAVAFTLALAVVIVNVQLIGNKQPQLAALNDSPNYSHLEYQTVQLHVLESDLATQPVLMDMQSSPSMRQLTESRLAKNHVTNAQPRQSSIDLESHSIESETLNALGDNANTGDQNAHNYAHTNREMASTSDALMEKNDSTKASTLAPINERKIKYKTAYEGLVAKQASVKIHHQTYATVTESDNGLSLVTCNKELLKLSQGVVNLLFDTQGEKRAVFANGQLVSLKFNRDGHIVQMSHVDGVKQC